MVSVTLYALLSVCFVSIVSLIGVFALTLSEKILKKAIFILVSLATGALLGGTFIHLVPEIYSSDNEATRVSLLIIGGILVFFLLEKFFHWHHYHGNEEEECHEGIHKKRDFEASGEKSSVGEMIIISDGLHNLIDGIIIGVSYLTSIEVGIAATIAIVLHEIPQEIGDFGVLLHAGYSKIKALMWNFLSALLAVVGTILALSLGDISHGLETWIMPLAAGGFLYIAGSDLIPELHKTKSPLQSLVQFLGLLFGVFVMYLLVFLEV